MSTGVTSAVGEYVERGWRIFPIRPRSKTPAVKDWPTKATHDADKVCKFWAGHPDFNVGLLTGPESGVVVVDIDPKSGGMESWADLVDLHGNPLTLSSITGTGGEHHFFKAPDGADLRNTSGNIGPGIDTRAWHGYVVLPPSIHPNGQPYEWDNQIEPEPVPKWLLDKWGAITPNGSKAEPVGEVLPQPLQEFVQNLCLQWGLKLHRGNEFAGPCPYPHLLGPCECERAFYVNWETGMWRCFCSDHPKLESKLVATGWIVSGGRRQVHQPIEMQSWTIGQPAPLGARRG